MSQSVEKNIADGQSDIFTEKVQVSGSYIYEARALSHAQESDAIWQAWRWDVTGPIIKKFADGNHLFDNVATDLTLLTYS